MMRHTSQDLELAESHVAQGNRHIARQHEIIEELRERGDSTDLAEQLLATFQGLQIEHERHRDAIRAGLDSASG